MILTRPNNHATLYDHLRDRLQNVRQYSGYFAACCPFHDDVSPSLLVYPDYFRCKGCRRHGPIKNLQTALNRGSVYISAEQEVSPIHFPDQPEDTAFFAHDLLTTFPDQAQYLKERKVDSRIEPNILGWIDGWYTIPVFSRNHTFKSLVLRASPTTEKFYNRRYLTPPGLPPTIFCPDWKLVERSKAVFVVYGIFDALALTACSVPTVTSTHGQNFNPEWLDEVRKPVYVVPDSGEEQAARELISGLGWRGNLLQLRYPDGTKDPAGIIQTCGPETLLCQLPRI